MAALSGASSSTVVQGSAADELAPRRAAGKNEAAERLRRELREIRAVLTLLLRLNVEERRRRRQEDDGGLGMLLAMVLFVALGCMYMSTLYEQASGINQR